MSYLSLPRITFQGKSYTNPSTANNNDIASVFDVDTLTFNPTMNLMDQGVAIQPPPPSGNTFNYNGAGDNPALRNWLMGLMECPDLTEDIVNNEGHGQMAHWNYYGDHNTEFQETHVTNYLSAGDPVGDDDPIYKLQVELLGDLFYQHRRGGVLVDVDPYALVTSQIFSGQLRLSLQISRKVKIPVFIGEHPTPAYSYFINPYKNLNPSCTGFEPVSSVFQFSIPNDNLTFPEHKEFRSRAIDELRERAGGGGLMVRFCLYDALYQIQAEDLCTDFNQGKYVFNPYRGIVLGTIGAWDAGELATAPPGRPLRIQTPYSYLPPPPELSPEEFAEKKRRMATVAKYRERKQPTPQEAMKHATLGATLAQVDLANNRVSLDCISTFPEATVQTRDKFDLGPLNLVLLYGTPAQPGGPPPNAVTIGSIPNDKATYESGGGMIDISYAGNPNVATINANIATGQLAIYQESSQTCLLTESPGANTSSDNRAVYFDAQVNQGGTVTPGTAQIAIQLRIKGAAPSTATTMNLEYWMCQKDFVNPDKTQVPVVDRYYSVPGATPIANTTYTLPYLGADPKYPGGVVSVLTDQVTVPAGGDLTLNLTALRPGVSMLRFVDPALQPPPAPNFAWDNCDYSTIRILPYNDYSSVPDDQVKEWPFIYDNFFSYYSVLHPIMSKVIPWGPDNAPNNPEEVKQFAANILVFTDPDMWSSTIYMPITRDMSGGKRQLLQRWCNLQQ